MIPGFFVYSLWIWVHIAFSPYPLPLAFCLLPCVFLLDSEMMETILSHRYYRDTTQIAHRIYGICGLSVVFY